VPELDAPPARSARSHDKPKAPRARAAVKPPKTARRSAPPQSVSPESVPAAASTKPDDQVDINGRRIRMSLEPTP